MKVQHLFSRAGLLIALLLVAMSASFAVIKVEVDGQPLSFNVPPMTVQNRTMVPMRGVFEALGAQVNWEAATRSITATRNDTVVQLAIGANHATVNGRITPLDVPAMIYRGTTMVPLRFISEALGAHVQWNEATQTVSIHTQGHAAVPVPATYKVTIPAGTVIPVTLQTALSSATNNRGDAANVSVRSLHNGDAEFPLGTKLAGVVTDVQRKAADQPGMLDMTFQQAQLPDGRTASINGSLISLDEKTVKTENGRLVAVNKKSNDRLKFIAVGAGAGLIIGKLLDKNLITGGLLGALAGYIYSEVTTDKAVERDVVVPQGTEFGVVLDSDLVYTANYDYVTARAEYIRPR